MSSTFILSIKIIGESDVVDKQFCFIDLILLKSQLYASPNVSVVYCKIEIQKCFTATVFNDVASLFFLKVSKIFHKTANSYYVYFFLSLRVQSSQMPKVISWQIDFEFKMLQKSQYWYFLSLFVVDNAVHQCYQQQIKTNIFE